MTAGYCPDRDYPHKHCGRPVLMPLTIKAVTHETLRNLSIIY